MKKQLNKHVYYAPRILSIIFILFLAMFSLDVFSLEASLSEILIGLIMHNIPVFILIILLAVSWKHEIVGAVTFFLAGILYMYLTLFRNDFQWYLISWSLTIAGPAFLIGALFLKCWLDKRQNDL